MASSPPSSFSFTSDVMSKWNDALLSAVHRDGLRDEIHRGFQLAAFGSVEDPLHFVRRQLDHQQSVAVAVVLEDVGEAGDVLLALAPPRGDHGLEAVLLHRPNGMLAARAAAEVVAGHQHRGARAQRIVQLEGRIGRIPSFR